MSKTTSSTAWILAALMLGGGVRGAVLAGSEAPPATGAGDADAAFTVDARIALHSFVSLTDAHLRKTADVLTLLATTDAVRSAQWDRVRPALEEAARVTVPAVLWFALPDGTYWTLEEGRVDAKLADRPYFPRLLDGEAVLGELVVSKSTHRNAAIVAVPVRDADGSTVGALGGSVHLDKLSAMLREEMGGLDETLVFFAIDSEPLGAVHSDPDLIFTEPMELGDEGMRRAFTEILAGEEGLVAYTFRDSRRRVLYRRSPVTGWWYGFGTSEPVVP